MLSAGVQISIGTFHKKMFFIVFPKSAQQTKNMRWTPKNVALEKEFEFLVGGFNQFETYQSNLIISPGIGVKIPKIFELPAPRFNQGHVWCPCSKPQNYPGLLNATSQKHPLKFPTCHVFFPRNKSGVSDTDFFVLKAG